jgi:hypothetical protein
MPVWVSWVTFGLALLGAGLGVFNAVFSYRRSTRRLRVVPLLERGKDGSLALHVKVINPGGVPVTVEQVFLARSKCPRAESFPLWTDTHYAPFKGKLGPGEARTAGPIASHAYREALMLKPLTVVAQAEDGLRVQTRCPGLREIYAELEAAAANSNRV